MAKNTIPMIAMKSSRGPKNTGAIICSLQRETQKMPTIRSTFANSTKTVTQLLEFILVGQSNPSIKKNGKMLVIILLKLRRQLRKYHQNWWLQENVDLITIDQNGQQNKSNWKFSLIILSQLKNISYPSIFTTETQGMIFSISWPKIEIDSQLELFIRSQVPKKNSTESQIQTYLLESMGAVSKLKKTWTF